MLFPVHHGNLHQPVAQLHGRGHGLLQALLNTWLHQQPVDYHFDSVVLALIKLDIVQLFVQVAQLAIDAGTHKSMLRQLGQLHFEFAFAAAHQRSQYHDALFCFKLHHTLHNLVSGLAADGLAATRTVRHADRCVEQA